MKNFLKQVAWSVAVLVPGSIITGMILDIVFGWEFAYGNGAWDMMKQKVVSAVKSIKNKIW